MFVEGFPKRPKSQTTCLTQHNDKQCSNVDDDDDGQEEEDIDVSYGSKHSKALTQH